MHNEKIILSNLNQELNKVVSELQNAFLEIQQPRTEFTLRHFVVGQHDTIEQQYAQCVLEMQIKYDNIRRALLSKKRIEIEIKELESKNTEIDLIDAKSLQVKLLSLPPQTARHTLMLAKTIWREAQNYGVASHNPLQKIRTAPIQIAPKKFLTWEELDLLDWFNVINYCEDQRVGRFEMPTVRYKSDNLVAEIKNYDFKEPYAFFSNIGMLAIMPG